MIDAGHPVLGFLADAYWMDLGTPEKYLQAHLDMLEGKVTGCVPRALGRRGASSTCGRPRPLGRRERRREIGADAEVDDTVVHAGARVGAGARVTGSVLAANATIGDGAIVGSSVLGEGARARGTRASRTPRCRPGTVAPSS